MNKNTWIFIICLFMSSLLFSQGSFVVQGKKGVDRIPFELINNLVIIPVQINGVKLSFILDTGVSKPIIFNFLNIEDSLQIKNSETIFLRGLGEGKPVKALRSTNNIFKIGDAININQDLYAVYDAKLNFAPRLGIPVHGIIGYDFFKDLVVEIHYGRQFIKVSNPNSFKEKKCKKCEILPLEFFNKKPYLNASVNLAGNTIPVKLLIDSGGSDALWLFEDPELGLHIEDNYFYDFLGHGLSGSVYGKRSKVSGFSIKGFELKNANVAFPDSVSINHVKHVKDRNGSLAGNILKRFNLIIDYRNKQMSIKKNHRFNDDFNYNKSGIELEHDGVRLVTEKNQVAKPVGLEAGSNTTNKVVVYDTKYKLVLRPAYSIAELREGSPAHKAGLEIGDVLLTINNKQVDRLSLQEIMGKFYDETGKLVKLRVDRNGEILRFEFYLKSLIDKKKP